MTGSHSVRESLSPMTPAGLDPAGNLCCVNCKQDMRSIARAIALTFKRRQVGRKQRPASGARRCSCALRRKRHCLKRTTRHQDHLQPFHATPRSVLYLPRSGHVSWCALNGPNVGGAELSTRNHVSRNYQCMQYTCSSFSHFLEPSNAGPAMAAVANLLCVALLATLFCRCSSGACDYAQPQGRNIITRCIISIKAYIPSSPPPPPPSAGRYLLCANNIDTMSIGQNASLVIYTWCVLTAYPPIQ